MAGRGDDRDGAGARQHVFLLPGKRARPGRCARLGLRPRAPRPPARGAACGAAPGAPHAALGALGLRGRSFAGLRVRTEPRRGPLGLCAPLGPGPGPDSPPDTLSPICLAAIFKTKAGGAETDRAQHPRSDRSWVGWAGGSGPGLPRAVRVQGLGARCGIRRCPPTLQPGPLRDP